MERYQLTIPTEDWISFLPQEAAEAYVLERSHVSKDRLGPAVQEVWARRQLVPRVTKECRQHLKDALAAKTGLPCRIGLTGRCHLKPPFSRKKRAPLFVTNGFCGRKDGKCLSFKFTVQDFDPAQPLVLVDVEVGGTLLTGAEGEERHSKRAADEAPAFRLKRIAVEEVEAFDLEPQPKRPRGVKRSQGQGQGQAAARRSAAARAAHAAVQAMQADSWPSEFELQTAEVVLDDAHAAAKDGGTAAAGMAAGGPHAGVQFVEGTASVSSGAVLNAMEMLAAAEPVFGEDATRELVELANQALGEASAGPGGPKYTATKIVQNGEWSDQCGLATFFSC